MQKDRMFGLGSKARHAYGLTVTRLGPQRVKMLWIVISLTLLLGASWLGYVLSPVQWIGQAEVQRVSIVQGASARGIARQLQEAGIIRSASAFHLLTRVSKSAGNMKAGLYEMSPGESSWRLLERINEGDSVDLAISVTIPEGYTTKQIAYVLDAKGIVDASEFLEYVKTAPLPFEHLNTGVAKVEPARRLEGYLFPDTYKMLPGSTPEEAVRIMATRFRQAIIPLLPEEVLNGGKLERAGVELTLDQLVTLASIVEREAVASQERPTIAGVFYNRLRIGQRLQSCATVQYILEKVKPVLSIADTEIESPYNTYQNTGLTPTPIASPGLGSLKAVINPDETPYFYFFAKGDGTHVFSVTFSEHQQAINQWSKP